MRKKRLLLSLIQLFLSAAAFIVVSFAWFVTSTTVESDSLPFDVSHEYIEDYEIRFFTKNNIYKYINQSDGIYIYNGSNYVDPSTCVESVCDTPSYGYWDDSYDFVGIFLNQYDPFIPVNNEDNYLFAELHLTYEVEADMNLLLDARSFTSMANTSAFGTSNFGPHYMSEVINIQYMTSTSYTSRLEGTNIFYDLKDDFNAVDINEDLIYPIYNFYGALDTYASYFDFTDPIILESEATEIYIYFSFSYYETKVDYFINQYLTTESLTLPLTSIDFLRFFQDIVIVIKDGGEVV